MESKRLESVFESGRPRYHRISWGYVVVDGIMHVRNYGQLKIVISFQHFDSFSASCWFVAAVALTLAAQEAH